MDSNPKIPAQTPSNRVLPNATDNHLTHHSTPRELTFPSKAKYRNRKLEFTETHNFLTIFTGKLDLITNSYPAPPPPSPTPARSRMDHLYSSEYIDSFHFSRLFPVDNPDDIPYDSDVLTTRYLCDTCEPDPHFWRFTPCTLAGHESTRLCRPAACYSQDHEGCSKCRDKDATGDLATHHSSLQALVTF